MADGRAVKTAMVEEFRAFFKALGFEVTWDFNSRTRLFWHEIYLDGRMLCQVDFDAPLEEFLVDLPRMIAGEPGEGTTDYEVRCPKDEDLQLIYDRALKAAQE